MSQLLPAFSDPVLDGQRVFRAIMHALSRPGTIVAADFPPAPAPLAAGLAAIALTLCDHETPLWLDPALMESDAVCGWLAFHTGARLVTEPEEAAFALVSSPGSLSDLERFAQGTDEYPDRSTTIGLAVQNLRGGAELRLTGPGIRDTARIAPAGLAADFVTQWAGNVTRFPRGIDMLLVAPGQLAGLTRTTRVEI